MDDISRELPPDDSGAAPVSAQQKGPEELVRFERGLVGDDQPEDSLVPGDRLAGMGAQFLADRVQPEPVEEGLVMASAEPRDDLPGDDTPGADTPHDGADGSVTSGEADAVDAVEGEAETVEACVAGDVEDGEVVEAEAEAEVDEAEAEVDQVEVDEADADEAVDGEADDVQADDVQVDDDEVGDGSAEDVAAADEVAAESAEADARDAEDGEIDAEAAQAAVAAEAGTASFEQDLDEIVDTEIGEDGLPVVPELTDASELSRTLFVLMLSSRDGMTIFRLAQACNTSQKLVEEALDMLQAQLRGLGLPVELTRVGDTVRWMSTASAFPYLQRLRGVKKLERLSPAALETLAVIAYRQPVMRSEIEAIRGVKAGPMLRTLLQHKLVKVAGRADVPGRPLQYGTTPHFLERFGLASLQELPSVKEWKNLG